jgi:hypothetical protein
LLIKFSPACALWQHFYYPVASVLDGIPDCARAVGESAARFSGDAVASTGCARHRITTEYYVLNCVSVASGEQTVKFHDLVNAMHGKHHGNSMLATTQSCTWEVLRNTRMTHMFAKCSSTLIDH